MAVWCYTVSMDNFVALRRPLRIQKINGAVTKTSNNSLSVQLIGCVQTPTLFVISSLAVYGFQSAQAFLVALRIRPMLTSARVYELYLLTYHLKERNNAPWLTL